MRRAERSPRRWRALRTLAYGSGIVALLGMLGPASAPQPPAGTAATVLGAHVTADASTLRGKTYVALGDSISAGKYAVSPDQIFPTRIAQALGMRLELIARSGARAAWGLPQLAAVHAARPALVTIELGTNDVGFNTPPDVFAQQYEAIVAAVSAPSTTVACLGSWLPSDAYDSAIRDACERHGGLFVSLSGFYFINEFHAPDGAATFIGRSDWFHPGNQGHAAIAAIVLASLPGYQGPDQIGLPDVASGIHKFPS